MFSLLLSSTTINSSLSHPHVFLLFLFLSKESCWFFFGNLPPVSSPSVWFSARVPLYRIIIVPINYSELVNEKRMTFYNVVIAWSESRTWRVCRARWPHPNGRPRSVSTAYLNRVSVGKQEVVVLLLLLPRHLQNRPWVRASFYAESSRHLRLFFWTQSMFRSLLWTNEVLELPNRWLD